MSSWYSRHHKRSVDTSLLQASDYTIHRAFHVRRSIRGVADQLLLPAGAEDVEQLAEHLELYDTGVNNK